jgi:tetratricopeptide (TPR) repeat protein
MAFFVSADTPSMLDTKLADLAGESFLNLHKDAASPGELDVKKEEVIKTDKEKVINALRAQRGRWVLVLDNADSNEARDAVNQLLDDLAGGRFLVTSRRENWPTATVRKLRLDFFNPSEAVSCLRSRYWNIKTDSTDEEQADLQADFKRLADKLGYLPLGLTLASSYMKSYRRTPGLYLEKWEEEQQKLLNFIGDDDKRSVIGAFKVSYEQLSSEAVVLLQHLAWLAPAPFPRRSVEDSQYLSNALKGDISEALRELQALSLIELDENSISVHSLVLACVQALMSEQTRWDSISSVLEWFVTILPSTGSGWARWLEPHLAPIQKAMAEGGMGLNKDGVRSLVRVLQRIYPYDRMGCALWQMALKICQRVLGEQDPDTLIAMNRQALCLFGMGDPDETLDMQKKVFELSRSIRGEEHVDTHIAMCNLLETLRELKDRFKSLGKQESWRKQREEEWEDLRKQLKLARPATGSPTLENIPV